MMNQKTYLTNLLEKNNDAVIIGSLGTISYDLNEIEHPNKILIKGAMGSVLSIGLGYAMATDKQVIVVIGDGAFLMKMGNMTTILKYAPRNLRIIILNNNNFKSCGNQKTNFKYIENMLPFEVVDVE